MDDQNGFGQPNAEIGRKKANGQLLFLTLLVCMHFLAIVWYNCISLIDIYIMVCGQIKGYCQCYKSFVTR